MLRPDGMAETVAIELIEGVEVAGQFVDAETGEPVAPVELIAIGPGRTNFLGLIAPKRTTDERGCFRLRLPPGEAELLAPGLPGGYAKAYPRGFRQKVEIPLGVRSVTLPPLRLRSAEKAGGTDTAR